MNKENISNDFVFKQLLIKTSSNQRIEKDDNLLVSFKINS